MARSVDVTLIHVKCGAETIKCETCCLDYCSDCYGDVYYLECCGPKCNDCASIVCDDNVHCNDCHDVVTCTNCDAHACSGCGNDVSCFLKNDVCEKCFEEEDSSEETEESVTVNDPNDGWCECNGTRHVKYGFFCKAVKAS